MILPCSHFGLLLPLNQQTMKGVAALARVVDSDYQGEIRLLSHDGGNEEYIENIGIPLRHRLVLQCAVIKVNRKTTIIQSGLGYEWPRLFRNEGFGCHPQPPVFR